jgi:hypothetical protein
MLSIFYWCTAESMHSPDFCMRKVCATEYAFMGAPSVRTSTYRCGTAIAFPESLGITRTEKIYYCLAGKQVA